MDKKKVQEAIMRIDKAVAQLNMNRESHVVVVNDIQLVSKCCEAFFIGQEAVKEQQKKSNLIPIRPEIEDERADEPVKHPEPCDENIEGGGDGI